jgi:hypothetical protein
MERKLRFFAAFAPLREIISRKDQEINEHDKNPESLHHKFRTLPSGKWKTEREN